MKPKHVQPTTATTGKSNGGPALPAGANGALGRGRRSGLAALSLSDQVAERLRTQIIHGERQPGERLVEMELAAEMGVSQGPVREALHTLENEGLVERQSRTATYVTDISVDEARDMSLIRKTVEAVAFSRAAERLSAEQGDELRDLVEGMRDAARRGDIVTLEDLDMRFHRRVCELSGSNFLVRVWTPLFTQLQRFIVRAHVRYFPDIMEIADGHGPLLDALLAGNSKRAAAAIEEHIMLSWSRINADAGAQTPAAVESSKRKTETLARGRHRQ